MNPLLQNQIICGDAAKELSKLPEACIDLTVTSPPYDKLRDYDGYSFDFETIARELFRVTKQGGVVVWVVGDSIIDGSESGVSFNQALFFKKIGFNLFDTMIYHKRNGIMTGSTKSYQQKFEYMFIFSKGQPKTIHLISDIKNKYRGQHRNKTTRKRNGELKKFTVEVKQSRVRDNIWSYLVGYLHSTKDKIAFEHPALFPEDLAKDHILSWSNEDDLILDPFAGAGTTLKMAKLTKRNYLGIEISQKYCDIIKKRLSKYNNQILEAFAS